MRKVNADGLFELNCLIDSVQHSSTGTWPRYIFGYMLLRVYASSIYYR